MKKVLSSTISGASRRHTIDTDGILHNLKSACKQVIEDTRLPIDKFTISGGKIEKKYRPLRYELEFCINLFGDILTNSTYYVKDDGTISIRVYLENLPLDTDIDVDLLYSTYGDEINKRIRENVYTSEELAEASKKYQEKLYRIGEICDKVGRKYGLTLEPKFYPSLDKLSGSPYEELVLSIYPTNISGKAGKLVPARQSGYEYVVGDKSCSTVLDFAEHGHTLAPDGTEWVSINYEIDYNALSDDIEGYASRLIKAIDKADRYVEIHDEAHQELKKQISIINNKVGENILIDDTDNTWKDLGFLILCELPRATFRDQVDEDQVMNKRFWSRYYNKIQKRLDETSSKKLDLSSFNTAQLDFDLASNHQGDV